MTMASPQTMKLAADMFRQADKDADRAAIEFRKKVRKNKKEKKEKDAAEKKSLLAMAKIFSVAEKNAKNKNKAQANKLRIRTSIEKTLNRMITFKNVFGVQPFQEFQEFVELDEVYPETIIKDLDNDFTTAPSTPRLSVMVQDIVHAFEGVECVDEIVQAYDEIVQLKEKEVEVVVDKLVVDELVTEELVQVVEEPVQVVEEKEEPVQVVEEPVQVVEEPVQVVEEPVQVVLEELVEEPVQAVEEPVQVVEEPIQEKAEEEFIVVKSKRSKAPIVVREYTLRSRRSL